MAKEYIDREKLMTALFHATAVTGSTGFLAVIRSQPAADVAPVVHGRWEYKRTFGGENIYACNVCGRVVWALLDDSQMKDQYPYCHCGAKMDLEECHD